MVTEATGDGEISQGVYMKLREEAPDQGPWELNI